MSDTLDRLIEDGVIDGVRSRLMSGKEASVFIVERQGELLAAKVYKAREQRTFKATASYTEGRNQTRNSRDKRAMNKRSSYGRELMEESWRDVEVRALNSAFHAGVRVPKPFMLHDDVLLMELLVDEDGVPAPRLADFELPRESAERLHREIYSQVRLLLSCGHIHGDLSAFNILMARGGPTLIDMPQVVDAARNNQAREILRRDLRNITEHLARYDARLLRFRDCGDVLWGHYVRGTLDAATEPQEGSVAGGHHRSRRMRDADRGRMGRERQDGGGGRPDGPPRHGPPGTYAAGQGPPRADWRPSRPDQGPPRDRDWRPSGPGDSRSFQGPHRDGLRPGSRFASGTPRREGNSPDPVPPGRPGHDEPRRAGNDQSPEHQRRRDDGPLRREPSSQGPSPARSSNEGLPRREYSGQAPSQGRWGHEGAPRREPTSQVPPPARGGNDGPPRREPSGQVPSHSRGGNEARPPREPSSQAPSHGRWGHAGPPRGEPSGQIPAHGHRGSEGPPRGEPSGQAPSNGRWGNERPPRREQSGQASTQAGRRYDSAPRPGPSSNPGPSDGGRTRPSGAPTQPSRKEPPRDPVPPIPRRGSDDNQG